MCDQLNFLITVSLKNTQIIDKYIDEDQPWLDVPYRLKEKTEHTAIESKSQLQWEW